MQENERLCAYAYREITIEAEGITIAYLPGSTGERIRDLREEHGWKRYELAEKIGISASTLGRIESGKTQTVTNETVQVLAQLFGVSTDYLLGTANTPDRKNYDIGELGLTVQAAKNLYAKKVNVEIVNRLLEQPRFATLTQMMAQYLDGTLAEGIAAQNQLYNSVSALLLGQAQEDDRDSKRAAAEAARTVKMARIPTTLPDTTNIEHTFSLLLKEMKQEAQTSHSSSEQLTKEIYEQVVARLPQKANGALQRGITPERMVDAITGTIEGMDGVTDEQLQGLKSAMLPFFQKPAQDDQDGSANE